MKWHLLLVLALCCWLTNIAQSKQYDLIAYYTGNGEELTQYPVHQLTHIIYSFLHLKGNELAFDNEKSRQDLEGIVAFKKKYPGLKVMIALGGWSGCATCSPVFASDSGRQAFTKSVMRILQQTNADGIDLDWEYPAIAGYPGHAYHPSDRENFTALIVALRQAMGNQYELSFAAGGFTEFLEKSIEWEKVMPYVNRVNLMTYDLVHGYSTSTGHHTALFGNANQKESTANCVMWLIQKGIDPAKLVIGAAFYARVWQNVPADNNGLYQPGKFKEAIDYRNFQNTLTEKQGFKHYWDKVTMATWAYKEDAGEFATFDDARSLKAKVDYLKNAQLGGIMFWELKNDQYQNGLLSILYNAIKE